MIIQMTYFVSFIILGIIRIDLFFFVIHIEIQNFEAAFPQKIGLQILNKGYYFSLCI